MADLVVPAVADWCALDLLDEAGRLQRVALAHGDPEKRRLGEQLHERYPPDLDADEGLAAVLRSGTPILAPQITEEMVSSGAHDDEHRRLLLELGMRSALIVPLPVRDDTIGTLIFVNSDSERAFSDGDVAFAQEIGARAATAVHNARLYRDRR